jgi:hypothetical protein
VSFGATSARGRSSSTASTALCAAPRSADMKGGWVIFGMT